jgi:parvulin-like peptidyl-prolyl isomerase
LLRPESAGQSIEQLAQLAEKIRQGIESGKITFEQAAARFSVAPSRTKGGDIGAFPRRGVMHDAFAKAAFELEPGQVSKPVATPFGVHLIRVTNIKPGTKQWTEVLDEMREPASVELFRSMAETELKAAKIQFAANAPHLDPATGQLVTPAAPAK